MKYGYMSSNPVKGTELPPEPIRERKEFPTFAELSLPIEHLREPISTAVWLVAVSSVRPNELAFKWKDLDVERRMLWVVRAVNRGKLHTPKYYRANRPLRLTEADVQRLLKLKTSTKNDDWVFPDRCGTGPIRHEDILTRRIQPVAKELGLPHITWRLTRHWGTTHRDSDKRGAVKSEASLVLSVTSLHYPESVRTIALQLLY
jgi:integrase